MGIYISYYFIISLVVSSIFIFIGINLAKVKSASFSKALLCAFYQTIFGSILQSMMYVFKLRNTLIGHVIILIFILFIIQKIFKIGILRASFVWIFSVLAFISYMFLFNLVIS